VTYDLTGSTYFIDAMQDFTITVQEPYDQDHNMGPGTITLRFADNGGAPAGGTATVVEYSLTQSFVTGVSGLASVTTDLDTWAGPDDCGVAQGTLSGTTLTFNPAEAAPYCRDGQVSCEGVFCGSAGSPPSDQPFIFNNDCSEPLPLNAFELASDLSSFTMAAVVLSQDSNQTTSLAFVGTETDRQQDSTTPSCFCD